MINEHDHVGLSMEATFATKKAEDTKNLLHDLGCYMSLLLLPVNPSGELTQKEIDDFRKKIANDTTCCN